MIDENEDTTGAGHPLFPVRVDDPDRTERERIGWIKVLRIEGGQWVLCPRTFAAEELQSEQDIFEMFGGGYYQLIARDPDNRGIVTQTKIRLPGRPLPLVDEAPEREPEAPARERSRYADGEEPPMNMTMMMFKLMQDSNVTMMKMQQDSTAMLMSVVKGIFETVGTRGDNGAADLVREQAKQNGELMRAMLAKHDGDGGALAAYREGQADGLTIATSGDADDGVLEKVLPMVQAAMTSKG